MKRNGSPKNAISIAKTRRVLRLALVWGAQNGWIEVAPIPQAVILTAGNDPAVPSTAPGNENEIQDTAPSTDDLTADFPKFNHEDLAAEPAPVAEKPRRGKKKTSLTTAE